MQEIFHDFTVLYAAGECKTEAAKPDWAPTTCAQCSIFESALATCSEPEPDALQKCMLAYAGTVSGCDAGCTHAFCKCMEDARADAKDGVGAIANGLVVAGITFVLFAILACMVERRHRRTVDVYEITEQMLPAQPTPVDARLVPGVRAGRIRAKSLASLRISYRRVIFSLEISFRPLHSWPGAFYALWFRSGLLEERLGPFS